MDQALPAPKAAGNNEDPGQQVPRLLELLWSQGQFQEPGAILPTDTPNSVQMAESAQSEEELHGPRV
jgi:hypothetical protein